MRLRFVGAIKIRCGMIYYIPLCLSHIGEKRNKTRSILLPLLTFALVKIKTFLTYLLNSLPSFLFLSLKDPQKGS